MSEFIDLRHCTDSIQFVHIKVKKLDPNAVLPIRSHEHDAGMDLTAISKTYDVEHDTLVFGTGLAICIPEGFVGLIFPRSSIYKYPLSLANSVGVIDAGYQGEIKAMFRTIGRARRNYAIGDRIMQLVIIPIPKVVVEEVTEFTPSSRGVGGFGSTEI